MSDKLTVETLIHEAYQLAGELLIPRASDKAIEAKEIRLLDILAYALPDALENRGRHTDHPPAFFINGVEYTKEDYEVHAGDSIEKLC